MLPNSYKKLKYPEFWRLPAGNYPTKVLFHSSCEFPYVFKDGEVANSKGDYVDLVVQSAIDSFNELEYDVSFSISGIETTDKHRFQETGTIVYEPGHISQAYASNNGGLRIWMGMAGKPAVSGCRATLLHEVLHNIGFTHKVEGIIKDYRPAYYSGTTLNVDDIHGIDVVYNHPSKYVISGILQNRSDYVESEVYLINSKGRLRYQAPVDSSGYFEFRIRNKFYENSFSLLVLALGKDGLYHFRKTGRYAFRKKVVIDIKKLTKTVDDLNKINGVSLE